MSAIPKQMSNDETTELIECVCAKDMASDECPDDMMVEDCWVCDDPVLRPLAAPVTAHPVCAECYRPFIGDLRKAGIEVAERRITAAPSAGMNATSEEREAKREWTLFVLFCVKRSNVRPGQGRQIILREEIQGLWNEYGGTAACFASKEWNFPKGFKAAWRKFVADHAERSTDEIEAELIEIEDAAPEKRKSRRS
jgi:hypothetical protein